MTKIDLKRELHSLYAPGPDPEVVEVPELQFLMVDGQGDPNSSAAFTEAIEALFSVSYGLHFMAKKAGMAENYTVMPLEALWWSGSDAFLRMQPSEWEWTAIICQPPWIDAAAFEEARAAAFAKRGLPGLERLRLESFAEGRAVQVMHVGPYSHELPTIERMHAFAASEGLALRGKHHEIYLGDPRRTKPERLRTVLRQPVA
jgi:hypothetical protein